MSTHANIYMPYGSMVLYKHFDGYPRAILPVVMHVTGESSIFVREDDSDPLTMMYRGSEADNVEEMGFLMSRLITQFAVEDYMRRTSTGLKFGKEDISAIVSPTAICDGHGSPIKGATYHYYIEKTGDVRVEQTYTKRTFIVRYRTKVDGVLEQLALIGEHETEDKEPD